MLSLLRVLFKSSYVSSREESFEWLSVAPFEEEEEEDDSRSDRFISLNPSNLFILLEGFLSCGRLFFEILPCTILLLLHLLIISSSSSFRVLFFCIIPLALKIGLLRVFMSLLAVLSGACNYPIDDLLSRLRFKPRLDWI